MAGWKGKGKKTRKGQGGPSKGGPSDVGGVSLVVDFGDEDLSRNVMYVEKSMRFPLLVELRDIIPTTFLDTITDQCFQRWKQNFPGLDVGDLVAKPVPKFPPQGSTFIHWNGVIIVELKQAKVDIGSFHQVSLYVRQNLDAEDEVKAMVDFKEKKSDIKKDGDGNAATQALIDKMGVKLARQFEESLFMEKEARLEQVHALQLSVKEGEKRLFKEKEARSEENERLERRIEEGEEKLLEATKQIHALELLAKKHVRCINQVRRRTALEMARKKAMSLLNKPPLAIGQKWSEYFLAFSWEDWKTIFGEEKLKKVNDVKNLLGHGSIEANKDIHDMEF